MNNQPPQEKWAAIIAGIAAVISAIFVAILSFASGHGGSVLAAIGTVASVAVLVISGFFKLVYWAVRHYGKTPNNLG